MHKRSDRSINKRLNVGDRKSRSFDPRGDPIENQRRSGQRRAAIRSAALGAAHRHRGNLGAIRCIDRFAGFVAHAVGDVIDPVAVDGSSDQRALCWIRPIEDLRVEGRLPVRKIPGLVRFQLARRFRRQPGAGGLDRGVPGACGGVFERQVARNKVVRISFVFITGEWNQLQTGKVGGPGFETINIPEEFYKWPGSPRNARDGDPLVAFRYDQAWEFVDAIRSGRACVPSFHDGARAQGVIDAAVRSAETKAWVDLEESN